MKRLNTISLAAVLSFAAAAPLAMAAGPQQGGGQGQQQADIAAQQRVNNQRILQEQPGGNGARLHVSPAVVRQIKQALNAAGYDMGQVNGNWDRHAQRGLASYQQAQGLAPTGQLNTATLRTLGVNVFQLWENGNAAGARRANGGAMRGGAGNGGR